MRRRIVITVGMALAGLAPAHLTAQQPAAAPVIDTAAPLAVPAGASLTPGSWRYRVLLSRGGQTIELAKRTLTVVAAPSDPSAWLLLDVSEARGQSTSDSLFVGRDGLRPSRRSMAMGPLHLALTFASDSVRGTMSAAGGEAVPVSLPMVPGLVASGSMLESALTLMPLAEGWAATAVQVTPGPTGTALAPATLRVLSADTVTVPAGSFEAWKVIVTAGVEEQWLWLDRKSGRLLRSLVTPPLASDVTYVTELTEASPPPS